jgi:hypothetical protein
MFAKLARFQGLGRRRGPPAVAKRAPCNDNRPFRRVVALSRRVQRPVLACRWRKVPATGRLECIWQVVPVDAAAAEEPAVRSAAFHSRRCIGGRAGVGSQKVCVYTVLQNVAMAVPCSYSFIRASR